MSSSEPVPSLRALLLSAWRRDPEHIRNPHYSSEWQPRVLCYSDPPSRFFTERQDIQSNVQQQLLENCEQYALNYIPTHLLRTSDMTLVNRSDFWKAEKPRIERELQEEDPQIVTKPALPDDEKGGTTVTTSNASCDNWHLRTRRGDQTVEVRQDTVRRILRFYETPDSIIIIIARFKYIRSLFKFAIFSHRWGDDEPVFQDVLEGRLSAEKPTTGYKKLLNFCDRAREDFACYYVWSDTCCINKESSVELDEAIRSMYRWYSIATVCIVHLDDSLTIDDFGSEPWFTRGWTLQELLAPEVIRFYGKDWRPIWGQMNEKGDKSIKEIRSAVGKITGIPHKDLRRFLPCCDRVAEKMAWASKRKTTKIEDIAYSLLGLFNVGLPIAYGEADKAWYRLMSVIANECSDASFFAWAGQPSPHSRALPSSPSSYSRFDPTCVSFFHRPHPSYEVTKLGVVIKMLVIPARCSVLENNDGREFGYTVTPHNLQSFLISADVLHGHVEEYKVGIVNFRSVGEAAVQLEDECHCLVLARGRSDDEGWLMVNTECVIVVRCLEEICKSPETVLLYHTNSGYDGTLLRPAHKYNPVVDEAD